jgi:hypothetical protein
MAKTSSEVSEAKDELQQYLGPRYVVGRKLGVSDAGAVFVVRDRDSGAIRLATFRGCITPGAHWAASQGGRDNGLRGVCGGPKSA